MIRSIFVVIENRWQSSCLPTLVKIRSCDLDASQKRNATNEWSYTNAPRRVHVLVVVFNSSDRRRSNTRRDISLNFDKTSRRHRMKIKNYTFEKNGL